MRVHPEFPGLVTGLDNRDWFWLGWTAASLTLAVIMGAAALWEMHYGD